MIYVDEHAHFAEWERSIKDMNQKEQDIGLFQRYLSLWVLLCMVAGGVNREIYPSIPCDSGEDADCRNIHTDGSSYLGHDLSDDDKSGF